MTFDRRTFVKGAAGLFLAEAVPLVTGAEAARRYWALNRTMVPKPGVVLKAPAGSEPYDLLLTSVLGTMVVPATVTVTKKGTAVEYAFSFTEGEQGVPWRVSQIWPASPRSATGR